MSWRVSAIPLLVASVLAVSACVPTEPEPSPSPSASDTPLFASEEEALAAATEAYAAYQRALDTAFVSLDAAPLNRFATGDALVTAIASVKSNAEKDLTQVGMSIVTDVVAVDPGELHALADGAASSVYACLNVSEIDVVDSSGSSVVPPDRPTVYPIRATVSRVGSSLLVSSEETWDGDDFCA